MPHCQTKHQKPCVCVWNTIIMYVWSTGAGLFARKNGWGEKAENTVLLSSYLVPCTAKSLYTMSSKTWHHLSKNATTDEILVSHVAHFLVRQFCREDVRGRRSKSWYIEQRFSLICAKIMSCIGHFWPFRPSRAFAKFLISKAFVKYEKGQARWRQLWNI